MERSQAINKQLGLTKPTYANPPNFYKFTISWMLVITLGSLCGSAIYYWFSMKPKDFIDKHGYRYLTGPSLYVQFCFMWAWVYKVISMSQILIQKLPWEIYKNTIIRDLALTVVFFIEYVIFEKLSELTGHYVELSGHSLVLVLVSSMVLIEGKSNLHLTCREEIMWIGWGIIGVNYYIVFWTSLAFHTYSHMVLGVGLGLATAYYFYFRSGKIKIK